MSHSTMWTDDVDADPDSDLSSSECNVDYGTDREQVHVYHHYTPQIQIHQDHRYPQTQSRTFLAAPRSQVPTLLSRSHSIGHTHTTDRHAAASPQPIPNFSHRLSRIPYHHHDVPELLTSRDDLSVTVSPSTPTPITPTCCNGFQFDDIFHPLSTPYRSRLGSTTSSCGQRTPSLRPVSNMSTRFPDPDAVSFTNSPNLGTTDTVSSLSSFETPKSQPNGRGHMRSISIGGPMLKMDGSPGKQSLSSTTSGSSEERNRNAKNASRRMGGLLARIWPGASSSSSSSNERRNMPADHKRSLTPHKLERPKLENVPIPGAQAFEPSSLSSYTSSRSEYGPPSTSHSLDVQRRGSSAEKEAGSGGGDRGVAAVAFGVDLKESIKIAPSKIRISHRGKSTSYRLFPLSVYKCCEFIRNSGCTDPSLFSSTGNPHNVVHLKDHIFNSPTYSYGDDFDFFTAIGPEGDPYTPYDAARLILIYLRELPKPLVSQSVLRSWIMLARQEGAIEPAAPKLEDMGFDFWTEALNRLSLHNRNLVKHLLDLFAEMLLRSRATVNMLAEAQTQTQGQTQGKGKSSSNTQKEQQAVVHEIDARRLASALSRSMFHTDDMNLPKKTAAHPTLALAFMIKKRGDYAAFMGRVVSPVGVGMGKEGGTRKERRERRESELFLPSTREILEWKGGGNGSGRSGGFEGRSYS